MELKGEMGPFDVALQAHSNNAKHYSAQLQKQYDAVIAFGASEPELPGATQAIERAKQLLEKFRREVETELQNAQPRAQEQSKTEDIQGVILAAQIACTGLFDEAKTLFADSQKHLEKLMCQFSLIYHPPIKGKMTVVSVDMMKYGRMIDSLEGFLGAEGTFRLNQTIREMLVEALQKGAPNAKSIYVETGDGALIFFQTPDDAVRFTEYVHKLSSSHNNQCPNKDEQHYHFRIGISTGFVVVQKTSNKDETIAHYSMGGKAIATAVRIQAAGNAGQILACEQTVNGLADPLIKNQFNNNFVKVQGKSHENAEIYCRKFVVYKPPKNLKARTTRPKNNKFPNPVRKRKLKSRAKRKTRKWE